LVADAGRVALGGLAGRTALVTGAGRNLGRAVTLALARSGVNVAVNVRSNRSEAEKVAAEAGECGVSTSVVVGDVSDPEADERMVAEARSALGSIDILVHCVGTRPRLLISETSIEEWRRIQETNCSSYFYLARMVAPAMAEKGFGRLIAIGGPDAEHASPRHGAIAASKAALGAVTRAVAVEMGGCGVTANIVSPTLTESTDPAYVTPDLLHGRLAIPRVARLDEVAFACVYLASDQAAYITGQTLRVDGGFTI
jgi:NAD(P)-dependent dehydrogenase (short-subunit alcohol dehydrogenase family)